MNVQTLFDALSDASRRNIMLLLMRHDELCVCSIHARLKMSQPKASRHLAVLRDSEMVVARRQGKWMHYRLHPEIPLWCYRVLEGMRDGSPELTGAAVDEAPFDGGCDSI